MSASLEEIEIEHEAGESEVDVCPVPNASRNGQHGKSGKHGLAQIETDGAKKSPLNLAQIDAELVSHTCHTAQDRNKAALDDFYSIYNGSSMYSDDDFKPDSDSLYWGDFSEGNSWASKESQITWKRASDVYGNASLYGSNGVNPDDIAQGALGNCWFLAAAATLAQVPSRVDKLFLNTVNELSPNGIYGVNFYTLGVPHTVIVDDWLPLRENWDGSNSTMFAGIGPDSALWVPILEKAFAKYQGNYEHIVGGDPRWAVRTLTGAPYDIDSHG